jgi:hypothetical protein
MEVLPDRRRCFYVTHYLCAHENEGKCRTPDPVQQQDRLRVYVQCIVKQFIIIIIIIIIYYLVSFLHDLIIMNIYIMDSLPYNGLLWPSLEFPERD